MLGINIVRTSVSKSIEFVVIVTVVGNEEDVHRMSNNTHIANADVFNATFICVLFPFFDVSIQNNRKADL